MSYDVTVHTKRAKRRIKVLVVGYLLFGVFAALMIAIQGWVGVALGVLWMFAPWLPGATAKVRRWIYSDAA